MPWAYTSEASRRDKWRSAFKFAATVDISLWSGFRGIGQLTSSWGKSHFPQFTATFCPPQQMTAHNAPLIVAVSI